MIAGDASVPDIVERLVTGRPLDGLGLERLDGRWDLRGLITPDPTPTRQTVVNAGDYEYELSRISGGVWLKDVALVDVDLRDARLPKWTLERCRVENCLFDGAALTDFGVFGSQFRSCSFERASLVEARLGATSKSDALYTGVSFVAADMRRLHRGSETFVDCDFSRANLRGSEFGNALLERCRFAGGLREVIFEGRRPLLGLFGHVETLRDVDFSAASFRFVEFRRLNLDQVTLPDGPEHFVFEQPRCVLDRFITDVASQGDPTLRVAHGQAEHMRRWLGPEQVRAIFAVADLADDEESRAEAVRRLALAVEACRSR